MNTSKKAGVGVHAGFGLADLILTGNTVTGIGVVGIQNGLRDLAHGGAVAGLLAVDYDGDLGIIVGRVADESTVVGSVLMAGVLGSAGLGGHRHRVITENALGGTLGYHRPPPFA